MRVKLTIYLLAVFIFGTGWSPVSAREAGPVLTTVFGQGRSDTKDVIHFWNNDVLRGALQTELISLDPDPGLVVETVHKNKFSAMFVEGGNKQLARKFEVQQSLQDASGETLLAGAPRGTIWTNSLGMKFVSIKPGTFTMGSNRGDKDEQPLHRVTLTKGFYLGVTEVTQAQWAKVMGENPSHFTEPTFTNTPNRPVESVSWNDVHTFIEKLSQQEGVNYRLPTEAEWEYSCRAGTTTDFYWGDRFDADYAWCDRNSDGQTQPVGRKKPNAWGLYDMSGNVYEWVQDGYGHYPLSHQTDPSGTSNSYRVKRSGSYNFDPWYSRSANRNCNSQGYRYFNLGFRLAISK